MYENTITHAEPRIPQIYLNLFQGLNTQNRSFAADFRLH